MTTVYLANYKAAKNIFEKIIIFWSPPYSHDEIVIDGISYSSSFRDGGVRKKTDIDFNSGRWDLIPVPWANAETILEFYEKTKHAKYDVFGLIGSHLFNRTMHDRNKFFCSEWCAYALGIKTSVFSPSSLARAVNDLNKVWYKNAREA